MPTFRRRNLEVCRLFREARERLGVSRDKVAEATSYPSYANCETTGAVSRDKELLKRVCAYLKINVEEVWKLTTPRGRQCGENKDNLMPIIKILAQTQLETITLRDLGFLSHSLKLIKLQPTPTLLAELVRQRQQQGI